MIEIVGEKGYDAVTVRELTRLAGVSTRAFYENFNGKEDCFLRTYEIVARETAVRFNAARKRERGDWMERLRAGSLAYVRELGRRPQAARLALVEALTAGPVALEWMRSAECVLEALIADSLAAATDEVVVPSILIEGITAGIEGVARARLIAGRERELPGLVDELLGWVLGYCGQAAVEAARLNRHPAPSLISESLRTNGAPLGDERERILSAVAKLAAADGYERLTVSRIRSEAGVSRRSFEAHFDGIADCFLSALERRIDVRLSSVVDTAAASPTWASGVHRGILALCLLMARDPTLARLAFVEVFAPGLEGVRCRERLIAKIARLFRETAPPHQRPSELASEASVNAVWGIVHHRVISGHVRHLPHITPALSLLALAPAIGPQVAAEEIRSSPPTEAQAVSGWGKAGRAADQMPPTPQPHA